ncbi:MAG: lysophospholipid acyltransferase family protein [Bacteroidota bacterium]
MENIMRENKGSRTPAVFFRNTLGRLFATWALLLFVTTLPLAFLFYAFCFLLQEPAKARWHRNVSRVWMRIFLTLIGCPLRIYGRDNYHFGAPYIVVCNHNSLMDVPVSTPFLPRANKTIAKKSFTRIPVFGWIYSFGSVLVDRRSEESRRKSFDDMRAILHLGLDMLIYPEGTRNTSGKALAPFYSGAFRLAEATGNSILPVLIFHTGKILPPRKFFYLWPHTIEMHILPAEPIEGRTALQLKECLFDRMSKYYQTHH